MDQISKNTKMFQLGTIIGETMIYAAFIIEAIIITWYFAPFSIMQKLAIILFGALVSYDIYKSFIHVKWVLWKQDLETSKQVLETEPDDTKKA